MTPPKIRHTINLWSLVQYPSAAEEWTIAKKLEAAKEAGFDGITTSLTPEIQSLCQKLELSTIGFVSVGEPKKFATALQVQRDNGATHVNVQLADEDTPVATSVGMAIKIIELGRAMGLNPAIEVHRDTCTETPEKTYAIADSYFASTGEPLQFTWDFSHLAVVKHIYPPYENRLLTRPELIQCSEQFHLRPFNGHHCQIPVTNGRGELTQEIHPWLSFAEKLMETWLAADQSGREFIAVPEMGPVPGGYNLSTLPNSWEDAVVLRKLLDDIWKKVTKAA